MGKLIEWLKLKERFFLMIKKVTKGNQKVTSFGYLSRGINKGVTSKVTKVTKKNDIPPF